MIKIKRTKIAIIISTLLLCPSAMANDAYDVFSLGEIVVSEQTGVRDITIDNTMTAEQIELIGAKTVADALDYIPGVHVAQSSKGEKFLTIQGFEQNKVLILLDGVPYYETNYGQLDLNQIPANIIAKIEVVKGASSVLYGPNGMGGVVNIITKKGQEGVSGDIQASFGQMGQNQESATLSLGKNGFSLFATVNHRGRDAMRMSNNYEPVLSKIKDKYGDLPKKMVVEDGGKRENSAYESTNIWVRGGYVNESSEIFASVFSLNSDRGLPYNTRNNKVFSGFSSFADISEYKDTGLDLSGLHRVNDWLNVRVLAYHHMHNDSYDSYDTPKKEVKLATSSYSDYTAGGALFTDMQLADWNSLSLSINYKNDVHKKKNLAYIDTDRSHDYQRSQLDTISFSAEDTMTFGALNVVAGIAWHQQTVVEDSDKDAVSGEDGSDTVDPMLGLSYTFDNAGLAYASIAQKTHFATFSEMFDDTGARHDLKPERNTSYTLGWKNDLSHQWLNSIDIGFFYHDISDKIVSTYVPNPTFPDADLEIYQNVGTSEYYGIEISTISQLSDNIDLSFDYSYIHARNTSDNRDSDYFRDIPKDSVTAILNWYQPWLDINSNLRVRYRTDILIDERSGEWEADTLTIDMGIKKAITPQFSAYFNLNNLLDESHYEGYGQPNEGRSYEAGVKYRF
ncbi:TonB-dependent receptor plug domain-containing protein [Shewanella benthica]|uniref:TonB-dependent receptor plug domain-containing protein n=1 Tax=Shewanella benthica TaxID=43661 RepID=UPI0005916246|nr:TonB-dependent receptor [Shewanella benthica]